MNRLMMKTQAIFNPVHRFDLRLFKWCQSREQMDIMAAAALRISKTADGLPYAFLALLLWLVDPGNGGKLAAAMALAFVLERPLYLVLKNSLKRYRPPESIPGFRSVITASDRFSFPSGHTSGAFLTATLLATFYPAVAVPAFAWATLVGASRVILGVHFPTDTLAGASMGALMAWCALGWIA